MKVEKLFLKSGNRSDSDDSFMLDINVQTFSLFPCEMIVLISFIPRLAGSMNGFFSLVKFLSSIIFFKSLKI